MKRILTTILVLASSSLMGQSVEERWTEFHAEPEDSNKVKVLLDIAYGLEQDNPDSALAVYRLAAGLGEKSGYLIGQGRALLYSGIVKSDLGELNASLEFYQQALGVFESAGYRLGVAATNVNTGVVYNYRGEYERAMKAYLAGVRIYDELNSSTQLMSCYGNVGGVFVELSQFKKGQEYFVKQLHLAKQLGDSMNIADAQNNLGLAFQRMERFDSAQYHYQQALIVADKKQNTYLQYLANNNMADVLATMGHPKKALESAQLALTYSQTLGNPYNNANALKNLGARHLESGNYPMADVFLDSAIHVSKKLNAKDVLVDAYRIIAENRSLMGDHEAAYAFQKLQMLYADSVFLEEQIERLNELEMAYETEKKDRELVEGQLKLERSRSQQITTMIALGVLALVMIFMVLLFRQKQKLKDQELESLTKEQEIRSVRAMLDGEEKERRRIARDLHDGLSALLASVKMKFSALQTGNEFEQALVSLDDASREVRRIAHNMMPEVLLSYGLIEALKEFLDGVNGSGSTGFKVDFQHMNMDARLESSTELMIYRVIQELINNIIKHADAKNVMVQLSRIENQISITVEDDGKGFDVETAMKKNGIGMANLQSRIDFLGGELSIDSSPQNGTSVYIELNLDLKK